MSELLGFSVCFGQPWCFAESGVYLPFPMFFPPLLCGQSVVLMREVVNTKQNNWIVHGTAGIGVAICVIMVED